MTIKDFIYGGLAFLLLTTLLSEGCGKKEEAKAPPAAPAPKAQAPAPQATPAPTPAAPLQASSPAPPAAQPAAKAIQTQTGMTGDVEVDVTKANIQEGILTVTLTYRNNGKDEVKLKTFAIDDVYFISETEKKKYHVLKDSKNEWVGAPIGRNWLGSHDGFRVNPVVVGPGGKAIVWFKFPAPPENVDMVNLIVPDVMPFDKLPVSR
jgi:hypothetical protein